MDEDDSQQFSLRWHNHQTSVIGALGRMLNTGALSDVTLSASGALLRAHRIVLAACSQYFAQLFKDVETENNTLVIVLGCEAAELRLLLTFMYTGEVTASRRCLPALLRLAHTLQVSGLTDADHHENLPQATNMPEPVPESPINLENPPVPEYFPETPDTETNRQELKYPDMVKSERDKLSKLDQIVQNLYSTHRVDGFADAGQTIPGLVPESLELDRRWRGGAGGGGGGGGGGGSSVCGVCHKRLSNQYNLRVHMETHSGRRHACRACSHVSRSRDALRKHVAYRHAHARDRHPTTMD